jgi:hypothetical protein
MYEQIVEKLPETRETYISKNTQYKIKQNELYNIEKTAIAKPKIKIIDFVLPEESYEIEEDFEYGKIDEGLKPIDAIAKPKIKIIDFVLPEESYEIEEDFEYGELAK